MDGSALVGRDRELEHLDEALRSVLAGERAVLMLSGEPGIGKSSLLEELARRVLAAGGVPAWGRVAEVGLTPAFWPWIQALSALESEAERAPTLGSLAERADAASRLTRFAEVVAFLGRRAQAAPIAILFDDLHAADLSSLQLLEYALPLLVRRRVLLALAARDHEGAAEVAQSLGRIQRSARRLPLARLSRPEVETLVAGRADAKRVFELSAGNPLFVEELLASASADGALRLPPLSSVRGVIAARVAALPESSAAALLAAAVLGRDFRGQVLAHMLGGAEASARLAPVLALGMVSVSGPDAFRFSHALVAEALADALDPSERARLHLRAAQACERHAPADLGSIAHHLLAAGHLAAEAAVLAAERAAAQCMAQLAFEDAAALIERALAALLLAAPDDAHRRAQLLCARAEALQHASRHADAAALCDEAAALVRTLAEADSELLARIALVRGLEFRFGRTDPVLVALLREALAALAEPSLAQRAKLLARLAAAEQPAPDPQQPMARALEAIELAAQLSPRDRMDVTYVASAALVEYLAPEALEPIHRSVLELARGHDRSIYAHTWLRLCFTALDRIDRPGFDAALRAFGAEAAALAQPRWTRQLHMLHALTALLEGRFADAAQAAAQCEAISSALGDRAAGWLLNVHRMMAAWVKSEAIPDALRRVAQEYPPGRPAILAWFAAQDGDRDAARTALAELGERTPLDHDLAVMAASAVAFLGEEERALRTYEALAPRAGRIVVAALVGSTVLDLYDRVLLVLASVARRWDAIDAHAQRALAIAEQLGSPVWAARVRADWAQALDLRGRPGDAARARTLWADALTGAERIGMPGLLARCRAHAQQAAVTGASSGAPPAAARASSSLAPRSASERPQQPAETEASRDPRPPAPARDRLELVASGELWIVRGLGEQVHVKGSRGMQLLARLIDEPGRELHVLDLAGAGADGATWRGDAGPLLDAQARGAYRARLAELRAAHDEAERDGDLGALARADREIEVLTAELERAFGLGGRERKAGTASERARSNVQRRISHAIEQIRAASPRLAEHLTACVRTGTYCSYGPATRGGASGHDT